MAMYLNSFTNIQSLKNNTALPPFIKFQFALSNPVLQRCQELSTVIDESSIKDLQVLFPALVENMFGYNNQPGWGFRVISRTAQPREFEAFRHFLSPSGPMLKLVYKLMSDSCLRYEFPVACLPAPTRRVLEEGIIPHLYVNKLQMHTSGQLRTTLSLNAFEFYIFHFAYYLVNPYAQKNSTNWTSPGEVVYQTVVDDYFQYFLPADGSNVPPLSVVISSRSSLSPSQMLNSGSSGPYNTQPRSPRSLGLLKHISLKKVAASPPLQLPENSYIETWRSEIIAQIFAEFWLNQNTAEPRGINISSVTQSRLLPYGTYSPSAGTSLVSDFTGVDPNSSLSFCFAEMFNPNYDHVRIVRMFIKHLHYFANSFTEGSLNPLEELKRNIISVLVQEKLYSFLRYMIAHWPLDASFRLVLETWLSYIQPWRYLDIRTAYNQVEKLEEKDKSIDSKWLKFVTENLAFYTVIFQQMLPRFFRMDLSTPKNAYMLYRVTKVYSQPNLCTMIAEAEANLQEPLNRSGRISVGPNKDSHSGSYISSSILNPGTAAVVRQQLIELEGPGFQYIPLFGEDVWVTVFHLVTVIAQAQEAVQQIQKVPEHIGKGFLRSLKSAFLSLFDSNFLSNSDEFSVAEINKVEVHLGLAENQLRKLFNIQAPESRVCYPKENDMTVNYPSMFSSCSPSFEDFYNTFETTSSKLSNGVCRTDLRFEGNPDLQPIRSYEIPILVRHFHNISSAINEKYRVELRRFYHRKDFIGYLCKQFMESPKIYCTYNKSNQLSPCQKHVLPPRINLRFLASKRLLKFTLVILISGYYFGFHPIFTLSMLILIPVFWAIVKAAFDCFWFYLR